MSRPIHIERPEGHIPGLIEVNEELVKRANCVIVLELKKNADETAWLWKTCYLQTAHLEGEQMVYGFLQKEDKSE